LELLPPQCEKNVEESKDVERVNRTVERFASEERVRVEDEEWDEDTGGVSLELNVDFDVEPTRDALARWFQSFQFKEVASVFHAHVSVDRDGQETAHLFAREKRKKYGGAKSSCSSSSSSSS
jgi:hypothetical protein